MYSLIMMQLQHATLSQWKMSFPYLSQALGLMLSSELPKKLSLLQCESVCKWSLFPAYAYLFHMSFKNLCLWNKERTVVKQGMHSCSYV